MKPPVKMLFALLCYLFVIPAARGEPGGVELPDPADGLLVEPV